MSFCKWCYGTGDDEGYVCEDCDGTGQGDDDEEIEDTEDDDFSSTDDL